MANLRDQLLKAGLIDKKAKHLAEQAERQLAKAAKADGRIAAELAEAEAEKARRLQAAVEAKKAADRAREAEKLAQLQAMERMHRLESTIDRHEISVREGRRRFYFRAGGKAVGRFDLQERQARALEDGDLCIVRDAADTAKRFKLMDVAGLAELRSIDEAALIFHAPSWTPLPEPGEAGPEASGAGQPEAVGPVPEDTGPAEAAGPDPSFARPAEEAGTDAGSAGLAEEAGTDAGSAGLAEEAGRDAGSAGLAEEAGPDAGGAGLADAHQTGAAEGPSPSSGIESGTSTSM